MEIKQLGIFASVLVAFIMLSTTAFSSEAVHEGAVFFSVFSGVNWENSGTTTSVNLGGGLNSNLYEASKTYTVGPMAGLAVGYRWIFPNQIMPRRTFWIGLGLESAYTQVTSKEGRVRPLFLINTGFETLNFNYSVSSVPLLVVGQLGARIRPWCEPYLVFGTGISWNRAFDYKETPTDPDAAALPMRAMFQSHSTLGFAFMTGLGVDFRATDSTNVGIEYRYSNFGNASLNPTSQQATDEKLRLSNIHSNALLFHMTVLWSV